MARYELVALNTSTPQLEAAQSGDTYLIPRTAEMETGAELRVYNTADMDTNYERGFMRWSGNTLRIGSEKGGSGTSRDVAFYRNTDLRLTIKDGFLESRAGIQPSASATYNLGSNTVGWRSLYIGTKLSADPSALTNGFVIWLSDGSGSGDDGDVMITINDGSTTKTATLVDFSAA